MKRQILNFTRKKALVSLGVLGLMVSQLVVADGTVNLQNGNYFSSYRDIEVPGGGEEMGIMRVYNSKTNYRGIFGYRWGNEYEEFLTESPDDTLVVHEYGGGSENRFVPFSYTDSNLKQAVDTLADLAVKNRAGGGASGLAAYKARLKSDPDFRDHEWEKYKKLGKATPKTIAVGTQYRSLQFSYQYITKVKEGFVRKYDTGKAELFGNDGRLLKIADKNGNFVQFTYKDGRLQSMSDNFNRKFFFTFNGKGLVSKIESENGRNTTYTYNSLDELEVNKGPGGALYKYKYDAQKHHNLIEINDDGKAITKIQYYGREKNENVMKVTDADGTVTQYDYRKLSDGNGVTVKTLSGGKVISTADYEYHFKKKSDGQDWTHRLVSKIDGVGTDTTYDEKCGLPLSIVRDRQTTSFEYDIKCRVTNKTTPTETTLLTYHPTAGKVSSVTRYPPNGHKSKKAPLGWSKFDYDAKGNLSFAEDSDRKKVTLAYDGNGRIKTMLDQDKRQISFEYNQDSKPEKITDPKLGSIIVEYGNNGEIKKVDSPAGRKIAVQVTTAFQNLLDIIRPAGVNLSF